MKDTGTPGALVPPTAAENPRLPRLMVEVEGRSRVLHLRRTGDSSLPVALVIPGGPGADLRLLLPLEALADRYHVVLWDPGGTPVSVPPPRSLQPRLACHPEMFCRILRR
jgi:proline iminopeptidase